MSKARAVATQCGPISDERFSYILGLDIGTTSIGWAIIEVRTGRPVALRLAGVRIFEAGVEGTSDEISRGRDSSRAAGRRLARLQRRQLWRRANRLRRVFVELQRYGLLPECDWSSLARHERLKQLDAELQAKHVPENDVRAAQLLPYLMRAKGVTEALTLHEFGRTLFHLGQRRGYRSNRKTDQQSESATDDEQPKKTSKKKALAKESAAEQQLAAGAQPNDAASGKEDVLKVKESISRLQHEMAGRTLGQYFATLDPLEHRSVSVGPDERCISTSSSGYGPNK